MGRHNLSKFEALDEKTQTDIKAWGKERKLKGAAYYDPSKWLTQDFQDAYLHATGRDVPLNRRLARQTPFLDSWYLFFLCPLLLLLLVFFWRRIAAPRKPVRTIVYHGSIPLFRDEEIEPGI